MSRQAKSKKEFVEAWEWQANSLLPLGYSLNAADTTRLMRMVEEIKELARKAGEENFKNEEAEA